MPRVIEIVRYGVALAFLPLAVGALLYQAARRRDDAYWDAEYQALVRQVWGEVGMP